jgi:P-type Ca2+ transporter type 2C
LGAVFISHYTVHKSETWNPELCNNILFFTLIFSQILHVFNMNAAGSRFFTSEVMKNRYVWYAVVACLALLFISYQVEIVSKALDIFPMSNEDWMISIGMSLASLIFIQILKAFKIVRQ